MPDQDTVRVKMLDGKQWDIPRTSLLKAKARGAVEVSPEGLGTKVGVQEFKEEMRGSLGFTPEGGVMEDIKTIGSGLKEEATHPLESAALVGRGASSAQQAVIDKAYEEQ